MMWEMSRDDALVILEEDETCSDSAEDMVDINLQLCPEFDSKSKDVKQTDVGDDKSLIPSWLSLPNKNIMNHGGKILLTGALYLCLLCVDMMNQDIQTLLTIFGVSILSNIFTDSFKAIPPLLGMLISGLTLRNVESPFSNPLPSNYYVFIRSIGLMVLLLRSGFELDLEAMKNIGWKTLLSLTCLPALVEAIASGVCACVLLDMPIMFGLTLGFILAAVSPAIVVSEMLSLQENGFGIKKGIPSLVIAAASFDDILAITGFSICMSFALKDKDASLLESSFHGPLTIIFGLILGSFGGLILSLGFIWNTKWKLHAALIIIGSTLTFGMSKLHYAGSGMLGCLIVGLIYRSEFIVDKFPLITTSENIKAVHDVTTLLTILWDNLCEPLLFGAIGHALYFGTYSTNEVIKSIIIICSGLAVRISMAFFATRSKSNLTCNERIFIALAWIPKATVQAALCSLPLDLAHEQDMTNTDDQNNFVEYGEQILNTAVLSILICAPIGSILIKQLGTRCLSK